MVFVGILFHCTTLTSAVFVSVTVLVTISVSLLSLSSGQVPILVLIPSAPQCLTVSHTLTESAMKLER